MERRTVETLVNVDVGDDGSSFTLHGKRGALTVAAVTCPSPASFHEAAGVPPSGSTLPTVCCRVRYLRDGDGNPQPASGRSWIVSGFDGQEAPFEGYDRAELVGDGKPLQAAPGAATTDNLQVSLALPGHRHGVTVGASCVAGEEFSLVWQVDGDAGARTTVLADLARGAYPYDASGTGLSHYQVRRPGDIIIGCGEVSGPLNKANRRLRLGASDALGYDASCCDPLCVFALARAAGWQRCPWAGWGSALSCGFAPDNDPDTAGTSTGHSSSSTTRRTRCSAGCCTIPTRQDTLTLAASAVRFEANSGTTEQKGRSILTTTFLLRTLWNWCVVLFRYCVGAFSAELVTSKTPFESKGRSPSPRGLLHLQRCR